MLAGNKNVGKGLLVVVLSYLAYNDEAVTIHFLSMDLHHLGASFIPPSQGQIAYIDSLLKQKNEESSIIVYDVGKEYQAETWHKKFKRSAYTPYALCRLFADFLPLPEKVLYLDTDTFILGNISPLYHTDMEDYEFAGCYDQLGTFWIGATYQNSGVLLFNMARCKETGLFASCRDYLKKKHPILADQDALNRCVKKKKFLPQIYNEQTRGQDDTVIRHFSKTIRFLPFFHTVSVKPWHVDKVALWEKSNRYDDVLGEYSQRIEEFEKQ